MKTCGLDQTQDLQARPNPTGSGGLDGPWLPALDGRSTSKFLMTRRIVINYYINMRGERTHDLLKPLLTFIPTSSYYMSYSITFSRDKITFESMKICLCHELHL
jgi:hypothetical protein